MNCTKCGKEIPEGENKICEDCQNAIIDELKETEKAEEVIETDVKEEKIESKETKESDDKFKVMKEKIKEKKVTSGLIFLIIVAIVVALTMFLINYVGGLKVGNTIGNIRNYGYAAEKGGWIYYLAPDETGAKIEILKVKPGKKDLEPVKLAVDEWDVLSLNVAQNYVYFIAIFPNAYNENDEYDNKIYRMKTDGSDLQVINDNEFNNDCYEIYVINNKVYYIGVDSNIYKMNTDGSNKELVAENGTGYLGITEKYIIYNVEKEDQTDYVTHIMDLNGKNARPIIEDTRLYSVNIDSKYIYYTNENKQICRVKIDGTEQQTLYDTTAYNMNFNGNYIYYLNYVDTENEDYTVCIYRVKKDGTTETPEEVKRFESYSSFIDVIGDWVIYMDYTEKAGFIEIVKIDGSEVKRLYELSYEDYLSESTEGSGTETENVEQEQPTEETNTVDTNLVTQEDTNTVENEKVENAVTEENDTNETVENVTSETNTVANEVTAE